MSSKRPDCTQCQEWELCPFHPAEPAPPRKPAAPTPRVLANWRLLGPDDPEVSTDLIYLRDDGTVVGVPTEVADVTEGSNQ